MFAKLTHYWINRRSDSERAMHMENLFFKTKVKHKRIEAITPKNLPKISINQAYRNSNSNIEYALICSHLKAISTAYNNGDEYAIILEDDMSSPFLYDLSKMLKEAPNDWQVLQLYSSNPKVLKGYFDLHFKLGIKWQRWQRASWSSGAYLINRSGMKSILKNTVLKIDNETIINLKNVHYYGQHVSDVVIFDFVRSYTSTLALYNHNTEFDSTLHTDHSSSAHIPAEQFIKEAQSYAQGFYQSKSNSNLIPIAIQSI